WWRGLPRSLRRSTPSRRSWWSRVGRSDARLCRRSDRNVRPTLLSYHRAHMLRFALLLAVLVPTACAQSEVWVFDSLDRIGGHKVTVEGDPQVIDTPLGKAIEFDGVEDALFLNVHPLAGAATFTWEAIFRPDSDGGAEQRIF